MKNIGAKITKVKTQGCTSVENVALSLSLSWTADSNAGRQSVSVTAWPQFSFLKMCVFAFKPDNLNK